LTQWNISVKLELWDKRCTCPRDSFQVYVVICAYIVDTIAWRARSMYETRIHEMHYGSLLGKIYVYYRRRFIHPCGSYSGNERDEERTIRSTSDALTIKRHGSNSFACTINENASHRRGSSKSICFKRVSLAIKRSSSTYKQRIR